MVSQGLRIISSPSVIFRKNLIKCPRKSIPSIQIRVGHIGQKVNVDKGETNPSTILKKGLGE